MVQVKLPPGFKLEGAAPQATQVAPKARIKSATIGRSPSLNVEFLKTPDEKKQDLIELSDKERVKAQSKIKAESTPNYDSARAKLTQSFQLFDRMNKKTDKLMGFKVPAAYGMRGLANRYHGYVSRKNDDVPTFIGDRYATAMALMRMIMPGRAEKMVEGVKQSLPSEFSSDNENFTQITESLLTALGTYASKNPKDFPEIKVQGGMNSFLKNKRLEIKQILNDARADAAVLDAPKKAKSTKSKRVDIIDKDGNSFDIPAAQLSEALKQGYRRAK